MPSDLQLLYRKVGAVGLGTPLERLRVPGTGLGRGHLLNLLTPPPHLSSPRPLPAVSASLGLGATGLKPWTTAPWKALALRGP